MPLLTLIKVVVVASLIFTGVWIKGVFAERDALRISEKAAVQTSQDIIAAREKEIKLQEAITNALKSIRVTSNNYIQAVEESPAPAGPVVTLVTGGLPEATPRLPVFANRSSGGTGAAAEAR